MDGVTARASTSPSSSIVGPSAWSAMDATGITAWPVRRLLVSSRRWIPLAPRRAGRARERTSRRLGSLSRVCYDHLAGWLAVAIRSALIRRGILVEDGAEHRVTSTGEAWLNTLGIDLDPARRARRPFARRCLDWSERRPHLAGALGSALLQRVLEQDWIVRVPGERTVELTAAGRRLLARELDLEVPSASISAVRAFDAHGAR